MSNAAVVNKFFETFAKQHDVEAADPTLAEDIVVNVTAAPGAGPMGKAAYKQLGYAYLTAFPDLNVEVAEQYEVGDHVISRVVWGGTHTGPLMSIPATGRSYRAEAIIIDRVAGGQIHERRQVDDMLGVFLQLGIIALPQGA
jgi:steroid delta-isomerase-like uncharacterized protein